MICRAARLRLPPALRRGATPGLSVAGWQRQSLSTVLRGKAVVYHEHGNPSDVLQLDDMHESMELPPNGVLVGATAHTTLPRLQQRHPAPCVARAGSPARRGPPIGTAW